MNQKYIKIFISLVLAMQSYVIYSQLTGLALLEGKAKKVVPFKYIQGFILLDVRYGQYFPLKFIFDTGAQNTIIFDKVTANLDNVIYDNRVYIMGADLSGALQARVARNATFSISNSLNIKKDIIVLENDLLQLQEIIGEQVHGILGADFFKGLIVHIDYKKSKLTFYDSTKFDKDKFNEYQKIKTKFIDGKPYIDASVFVKSMDSVDVKLLMDTGASISMMLHNNTHSSLTLPNKAIRGNLGKGLSGEVSGFVGKINKLSFNQFDFDQIVCYFQEYKMNIDSFEEPYRNGLIGNYLLDRFTVFVDYVNNAVYLKPLKNYNRNFKYDRSGLVIFSHGIDLKEFIINDVIENSPAYRAGLQPKDAIISIGFYTTNYMTLEKVCDLLSGKVGKTIRLKVLRNGKVLKFKFKLEDLF